MLAIIAEVLDQLILDLDYQIVYQVELVAFSLGMKVIVSQLDLFWLTYIELSLESRGEIILIAPSLLQQIDEYVYPASSKIASNTAFALIAGLKFCTVREPSIVFIPNVCN